MNRYPALAKYALLTLGVAAAVCAQTPPAAQAPSPAKPVRVQAPARDPNTPGYVKATELPDGSVVESERFMVAICTCRRSKSYPLCDTSHRRRRRGEDSAQRPA